MIRLSAPSKMPCKSWSLQALDTCPGSRDATGELVPACSGCYATAGNYRYPNVQKPRIENREDWKRDAWVSDMIAALQDSRYFRWFDSGDCYDVRLAKKILAVMQQTSWCQHWMPTRMYKFAKFLPVFAAMQALPNVVVRYSSDSITGETIPGETTSTIVPHYEDATADMKACGAYAQGGKCLQCRACWDKTIRVIAYPAHGAKMNKQLKQLNIIARG